MKRVSECEEEREKGWERERERVCAKVTYFRWTTASYPSKLLRLRSGKHIKDLYEQLLNAVATLHNATGKNVMFMLQQWRQRHQQYLHDYIYIYI